VHEDVDAAELLVDVTEGVRARSGVTDVARAPGTAAPARHEGDPALETCAHASALSVGGSAQKEGQAYPDASPGEEARAASTPDRRGVCSGGVRVGIADHLGWAIAVTASDDHEVVDRRRIELVEPGVSAAPIHYESRRLDVAETTSLVETVRASVVRATSAVLAELAAELPAPIRSLSLRAWPLDFPDDIAIQRRAPYEARADAIMYRRELAELARGRGFEVHVYDAKAVLGQAARLLAERADDVLYGPRARLGPPWTNDHRVALAATIVAA
jgi:hypothetical protein